MTGATGFVGRHVVAELVRRGFAVRALVRDRAKARDVLPRGEIVAIVEGEALAEGVARELARGADACIHLIGIIREESGGQTFQRMHVQATRAVVDACAAGGPKRYLHMSALGVSPEGKSAYQKTKWEAEQIVRRSGSGGAGGDGLEWTIFRPSLIHGAQGEFVQMIKGLCSGQEPPYYFIPYFTRAVVDQRVPMGTVTQTSARVSPVWVDDVARAFVEAISRPETVGEVYNLVGPDELTWPELLTALRDAIPGTNHTLQPWGIPGSRGIAVAKVARVLGLGGMLPFDEGQVHMAMEDSTAERSKVRAHLGLEPRAFAAALDEYAARA